MPVVIHVLRTGGRINFLQNRPPALSFKIAKEYFDLNLSDQANAFELDSDGGYYQRTIPEKELSLAFDPDSDGRDSFMFIKIP